MFLSETEVLYLRNVVWEAAIVKQMFQSGMFDDEDAVKEVQRLEEKMSYQVRRNE